MRIEIAKQEAIEDVVFEIGGGLASITFVLCRTDQRHLPDEEKHRLTFHLPTSPTRCNEMAEFFESAAKAARMGKRSGG